MSNASFWRFLLLVCCLGVCTGAVYGQQPAPPKPAPSMSDVEKLRKLLEQKAALDKALTDLDALTKAAEAVTEEKKIECVGAFGHLMFCSCIAENIPVGMNFQLYAVLLSKGRESFGYPEKVSTDDRKQMDTAYAAREKCVKAAFFSK